MVLKLHLMLFSIKKGFLTWRFFLLLLISHLLFAGSFYYYVMNKLQMNDVAKRSTLIAFSVDTGVYIMLLLMVMRWLFYT